MLLVLLLVYETWVVCVRAYLSKKRRGFLLDYGSGSVLSLGNYKTLDIAMQAGLPLLE
jgi:hypothetical protein